MGLHFPTVHFPLSPEKMFAITVRKESTVTGDSSKTFFTQFLVRFLFGLIKFLIYTLPINFNIVFLFAKWKIY